QLFLNLVVNALQSLPESGRPDDEISVSTRTDAQGRAVVEIADTGAGIPPELLARVFDPFFTTKPVGVGTGLGLPISQAIAAGLGGSVELESELGRGTLCRVTLPPSKRPPDTAEPRRNEATVAPSRARVLVVDDERFLVSALCHELSRDHDVVGV